jgi:hypothetical protein
LPGAGFGPGSGMVLIFVEDEFLQALDTQAMQITIAPRE